MKSIFYLCVNLSALILLPAALGYGVPGVVHPFPISSQGSESGEETTTGKSYDSDEIIVRQAPNQYPKWTPDTENAIWKDLNFPQEPEVESEQLPPATSSPYLDLEKEFNLTRIGDGLERRIAGGRLSCQCGKPVPRIVNGEKARINDIPWTVALIRRGGFFNPFTGTRPFCGGTIINDRYILTASHCVDGQIASGIQVLVNEEDFLVSSETAGSTKKFGVSRIIMHEKYNRRNVENDIALLKLDAPINIGSAETPVVPACLPANNDADFSGLTSTVAGWGTTSEGGSVSSSLRKVDVPIITNVACNNSKYKNKIFAGMLCAGYLETGGKDSCQGDSGGPLIIDNGPSRKTLVGVVSWGYGCAKPNAPGVYTRVSYYAASWILENTRDAQWCTD